MNKKAPPNHKGMLWIKTSLLQIIELSALLDLTIPQNYIH